MATSSARRYLTANGFKYLRDANHGEVWTDGERNIMISRSAEAGHPGLKKDLRNALRERREKNPFVASSPAESEEEMVSKHEGVHEPVRPSEPTKSPRQLPLLVMTILTDPELTDGQKVKMIMAYAELE